MITSKLGFSLNEQYKGWIRTTNAVGKPADRTQRYPGLGSNISPFSPTSKTGCSHERIQPGLKSKQKISWTEFTPELAQNYSI